MGEEDTKLQLEESMDGGDHLHKAKAISSEDSSPLAEKPNKDAPVTSESKLEEDTEEEMECDKDKEDSNQENAAESPKKSKNESAVKEDSIKEKEESSKKSKKKSASKKNASKEKAESAKKSKKNSAKEESKIDSEESEDDADTSTEKVKESSQVVTSGKRDRKKVERLSFSAVTTPKVKIEAMGSGISLGEIPYVEHMISSCKSEDLKLLHALLYRRSGNKNEIKRNLRCFNGFSFSQEDEEYKSLISKILKWPQKATVAKALSLFGQHVTGSKQELSEKLAEFLLSPFAVEKAVPGLKKKKSASKRKTPSKKSATKTKRKSVSKKQSKKSDSEHSDDEEEKNTKPKSRRKSVAKKIDSDSNEESGGESSEESDNEENNKNSCSEGEEESSPVKKPKAKTPAKPVVKKAKATPAQKRKKEEDSCDESDEEPLVKKTKKSAPSDDDIKAYLKEYMKSVDLEEVTMKSIYQKVYDQYPEADLTPRKEFIKETVKKMLA